MEKRKVYFETKMGDYEVLRVASKKETKKYLKEHNLSDNWIVFVAKDNDGSEFLFTSVCQDRIKSKLDGTFNYRIYDEWDE